MILAGTPWIRPWRLADRRPGDQRPARIILQSAPKLKLGGALTAVLYGCCKCRACSTSATGCRADGGLCGCSESRSGSRPGGGMAGRLRATTTPRSISAARGCGYLESASRRTGGSSMECSVDRIAGGAKPMDRVKLGARARPNNSPEVPYAELHCLTNFTFLRGASHPHELVGQAVELGYEALAITDECSVAGVVRAHVAAKGQQLKLIIGSELRLTCGLKLVALATNRRGYGRLCRLITRG